MGAWDLVIGCWDVVVVWMWMWVLVVVVGCVGVRVPMPFGMANCCGANTRSTVV